MASPANKDSIEASVRAWPLLWALLRPRLGLLSVTSLAMITAAGCTAAYAWLAGPALVILGKGSSFATHFSSLPKGIVQWFQRSSDPVVAFSVLVVGLATLRAASHYLHQRSSAQVAEHCIFDLRNRVLHHLLHLEANALQNEHYGKLSSRIGIDVIQAQHLIGLNLANAVRDLLTLGGLFVLLFSLKPTLATMVVGAVPVVLFGIAKSALHLRGKHLQAGRARAEFLAFGSELAQMVPLIRSSNAQHAVKVRFNHQARTLQALELAIVRHSALVSPAVELCTVVLLVAVFLLHAKNGMPSLSTDATFVSFFAAAFFMYRPLVRFGSMLQSSAAGFAALDRIVELLNKPTSKPGQAQGRKGSESFEVEKLCAGYDDRVVVRDVQFALGPGATLALVGRSGSGKSTLLKAVLGHATVFSGSVCFAGQTMQATDTDQWAQHFSWLPQTPRLLSASLLDNVAFGDSDPDRTRAKKALQDAGAGPLLASVKHGLETLVGEGGLRHLSVGEMQRIGIARCLYRDADVLVMDEPTAALDGPTELELAQALALQKERKPSQRIILATHRLSTVMLADEVVVLEEGNIVERGSPRKLWIKRGMFYALFKDQLPIALDT